MQQKNFFFFEIWILSKFCKILIIKKIILIHYSGLDMHEIVSTMCNDEMTTKLLSESSTFTLAYGIHKLFAPIRIMITLAVAPALVRFLRRKGILKHPEIIKKLKEAKLQNNQKT